MTRAEADRRRALLRAALGFALLDVPASGATPPGPKALDGPSRPHGPRDISRSPEHSALRALKGWLSTWRGIGLIAAGMACQGYDLSLTRYAELGWRATFYVAGREHSPTGATGSAFERAAFRAVHVAAWETLAGT